MPNKSIIKRVLPVLFLTLSATHSHSDSLWQKGSDYVDTAQVTNGNFDHPYNVHSKKVAQILSHVVIQKDNQDTFFSITNSDSSSLQVFTAKEIDALAHAVSELLSSATENDIIRFTISDQRSAYLGGKKLSTSGSIFIKNNQLNLLLGEVHVDFQRKYLRSGSSVSNSRFASNAELSKFKLSTGSFTDEGEHKWALGIFPGAKAINTRSDWIGIDLNKNYDFVEAQKPKEHSSAKYYSENQKQQLAQPEKLEARIRKLEEAQVTESPASTIESRLSTLRDLYKNGVIPEEAYRQKLDQILSEI